MNKYLKKIIILVILLLGYILFIGSYKIEFKKQINDGNIKISINNFLTDFFNLKNSQLSGNELIKEFYEGGYFPVRDDLLSYVYSNKFFYNLENNYKKEILKIIIYLKIYMYLNLILKLIKVYYINLYKTILKLHY